MLRRLLSGLKFAALGISLGLIIAFTIIGVALSAVLYGIHSNGYELRIVPEQGEGDRG